MSDYSALSDGELARRVQQGDVAAYDEFIKRFTPAARRTIVAILQSGGCTADVDDVIQETFLKLFKRRQGIDYARNIPALVKVVAYTRAIDEVRNVVRRTKHLLQIDDDSYMTSEGSHPERIAQRNEFMRSLADKTSPLEFTILYLRDVENQPFTKIAENVRMTPKAVARLHDILRRRLKRSMAGHDPALGR